MNKDNLLTFGRGNAKLDKTIHTFSLPAGWTCPGALHCMARADRTTGKVYDGEHQKFRCFAASAEATYKSVRESRWRNLNLLRDAYTAPGMRDLILASLPKDARVVRVHVSGDFFSGTYFSAWMDVATRRPDIRFYAYTKSIQYWKSLQEFVPDNFVLTASLGGRFDAHTEGLKTAQVVFSEEQAAALGLEIDHDDSHAIEGEAPFALLLHGSQKAGTEASRALTELRAAGKGGYSRKK